MADFNDFKEKMLVTLGKVADTTKDLAEKTADAAKASGRIAKLSVEIASEKDNMKKTYIEIGKLYYDTHKDDPDGFFIQLCEEVTLTKENIADKEAEIEAIKGDKCNEGDIEVEFEEVVSEEESCACSVEDFASGASGEEASCECDAPDEETESEETYSEEE